MLYPWKAHQSAYIAALNQHSYTFSHRSNLLI